MTGHRRPGLADMDAVARLAPAPPSRVEALLADIADPAAPVDALIAVDGSALAIWHAAYDAERARHGAYLCACAAPDKDAALAVFADVRRRVSEAGGRFIVWHVADDARALLTHLGAPLPEGAARILDEPAFDG